MVASRGDQGAGHTDRDDAGAYDQKDAAGFIQLNALRLKLLAARKRRLKG